MNPTNEINNNSKYSSDIQRVPNFSWLINTLLIEELSLFFLHRTEVDSFPSQFYPGIFAKTQFFWGVM